MDYQIMFTSVCVLCLVQYMHSISALSPQLYASFSCTLECNVQYMYTTVYKVCFESEEHSDLRVLHTNE